MDKEETTASNFSEGKSGGGDGGYGEANMYLMTMGNNLKNLNTPVSNEPVVKRNEPTERHLK